ncbi:MAG: PhoH family protein [Erysipelotrichaceae bacterium]|nr:PhoH family protein [Erysipelotrichaceae bacterium]
MFKFKYLSYIIIKGGFVLVNNKVISFPELDGKQALSLVGIHDKNLNVLSECFGKKFFFRNNEFIINDVEEEIAQQIEEVLMALYEVVKKNQSVSERDVLYAYRLVSKSEKVDFDNLNNKIIGRTLTGKIIAPKTKGQLNFVNAMEKYDVVLAIGPAGTGKTYLAVIQAVSMLKKGLVKRIVLTRPAVEAGENLGFLPGDLKEKVDPYLTPLYDSLYDMLGVEQTEKLIEKKTIEIAPLAYMRGRTLEDAFVILDEAQNTTTSQMKMFLTRLGFNSKMVITGDITQIDLNHGSKSGLIEASNVLKDVEEIKILYLTADDVVRHPLVQKIIESYEKSSIENNKKVREIKEKFIV